MKKNIVEVFKTNMPNENEAKALLNKICSAFPEFKINFDLSDYDKILRVEGREIAPEQIIQFMHQNNYKCEILS